MILSGPQSKHSQTGWGFYGQPSSLLSGGWTIMREIASFITNRLGNAIYFLSTTQPRCWMFQRGRSSVMKLYLWQSNSRSHEVSLVWVRIWLAAHTHLTQGVGNYMAQTQSMEIGTWRRSIMGGERQTQLNQSPSHHCQGVGGCVTAKRNQSWAATKQNHPSP